jgi:hypothetical protein
VGTKSVDESKLIEYLLGETSEAETEQFDELSITDDEFAGRLSAAEHELVDAYARGELPANLRDRFARHYLASPRRRANVESAETFLSYVDKTDASAISTPAIDHRTAEHSWLKNFFALSPLKLGFASLGLLAVIGGGFLIFDNLRLRDQLRDLAEQRKSIQARELALEQELEERRSASADTERQLAEARERRASRDKEPGGTTQSNLIPLVAFNLLPPLRGVTQPPEFRIPATPGLIAFNVVTEATDFPTYHAELKETSSGRTVWQSGNLKLDATGKTVRLSLRSKLFSAQNYSVELAGVRPNGSVEKIGSYTFKVLK